MNIKELKLEIIKAGHRAVEQLIKVAKEDIIKPDIEDELAADRLKNAAATKKLAIFDALEILNRIEQEKENLRTKNLNDAIKEQKIKLNKVTDELDLSYKEKSESNFALQNWQTSFNNFISSQSEKKNKQEIEKTKIRASEKSIELNRFF